MAVNTIDKLQFLSFIFAVLLSVTVHFIPFRLGRTIMYQYTKIPKDIKDIMFFIFSR